MCFMCDKWGEGGIWYLNPKVYSRRMYKLREQGGGLKGYGEAEELKGMGGLVREALRARNDEPEKFPQAQSAVNEAMLQRGGAQAITLREAYAIVDLGMPLASMHCVCRKNVRAIEETNSDEYSCLGTGVGMFKWERWPERYRGGVHFMSPRETRAWLERWDREGFMHLVMMIGNGYVEGICNCEYPDCYMIRQRLDLGILGVIKGHYVAQVDYSLCNGCGVCVQRCQFGAVKFEVRMNKTNIDQFRCFGCGLCETGCPTGAISMIERERLPGLKNTYAPSEGIPVLQRAPRIEIDYSKCFTPFACKKCLQICPQAVFRVEAVKVERLRETDPKEPGAYKVEAESRFACTGCDRCVQVCPVSAIAITWP